MTLQLPLPAQLICISNRSRNKGDNIAYITEHTVDDATDVITTLSKEEDKSTNGIGMLMGENSKI